MKVYIEGNIACGKSTFTKKLSEYFDATFVQEPVDEWLQIIDSDNENILQKFYYNKKRWAYSFQMKAFIGGLCHCMNRP